MYFLSVVWDNTHLWSSISPDETMAYFCQISTVKMIEVLSLSMVLVKAKTLDKTSKELMKRILV